MRKFTGDAIFDVACLKLSRSQGSLPMMATDIQSTDRRHIHTDGCNRMVNRANPSNGNYPEF